MRVLIVPMTAMAETAGSYSRTVLLAKGLEKSGIEVATCAAEDFNFRPIKGLRNYYLTIPNPLGLPQKIAVHTFPVAQKLGITTRKSVNSFDDVLYLTGNTQYSYIKRSVGDIRNAIRDFKPDVIYSEFNISAIVAGKIEHKRIYPELTTHSGLGKKIVKIDFEADNHFIFLNINSLNELIN